MPEKLDNSAFSNNDFFHDVDFTIITFLTDYMGFNTIDLNNINLDHDNNFDENNPERSYQTYQTYQGSLF